MSKIDPKLVQHMALLSAISLDEGEGESIAAAFNETLDVVDQLHQVDTSKAKMTHQVTGLENVTRDDVVEEGRMFSQEEALANAKRADNGFFVVERVIDVE